MFLLAHAGRGNDSDVSTRSHLALSTARCQLDDGDEVVERLSPDLLIAIIGKIGMADMKGYLQRVVCVNMGISPKPRPCKARS